MKKFTITLAIFATLGITSLFANPNPEKREFKNTHHEINLEVERLKGEVAIHLLSQNFTELDQVIIERSGDGIQGFTPCKVLDVKDQQIVEGNYVVAKDRFPYPASVDTYYRVKTISKEGITKTYAPIQLQALHN